MIKIDTTTLKAIYFVLTADANLVATTPGATQLTLILSCTTSLDIAFVNPSNVVLLTLYGPSG